MLFTGPMSLLEWAVAAVGVASELLERHGYIARSSGLGQDGRGPTMARGRGQARGRATPCQLCKESGGLFLEVREESEQFVRDSLCMGCGRGPRRAALGRQGGGVGTTPRRGLQNSPQWRTIWWQGSRG